jgi:hypothetical protein
LRSKSSEFFSWEGGNPTNIWVELFLIGIFAAVPQLDPALGGPKNYKKHGSFGQKGAIYMLVRLCEMLLAPVVYLKPIYIHEA